MIETINNEIVYNNSESASLEAFSVKQRLIIEQATVQQSGKMTIPE